MTSHGEEEERGTKATVSPHGGGGKEQRGTALTRVAKIVEIVGTSDKSWEDAAMVAVEEARKTIRGMRGIKVKDMTARIDPASAELLSIHPQLIYHSEYWMMMMTTTKTTE